MGGGLEGGEGCVGGVGLGIGGKISNLIGFKLKVYWLHNACIVMH